MTTTPIEVEITCVSRTTKLVFPCSALFNRIMERDSKSQNPAKPDEQSEQAKHKNRAQQILPRKRKPRANLTEKYRQVPKHVTGRDNQDDTVKSVPRET